MYKMNISSSSRGGKTSSTRGKQAGWAAFDLNKRQKQGEPGINKDPYPPITSSFRPLHNNDILTRNNDHSLRPFSSVVLPSIDFPSLTENKDDKQCIQTGSSNSRGKLGKAIVENNYDFALEKLRALHSWADDSLVEDIMAAVANDIEKASILLNGMNPGSSSSIDKVSCDDEDESILVQRALQASYSNSSDRNSVKDNQTKLTDVYPSRDLKLYDTAADMRLIIEQLRSIPVEPEWEEDDIYLNHRKDAIKVTRSASQHSKAATNAFLRGDHYSAKQHSLKAQEEWFTAARLNSKAANEILSIRNSKNDMWALDLHGLHAAEAVQALQERLRKIEIQPPSNRSVSPTRVKERNGIIRTPSFEFVSHIDAGDLDKQQTPFRHVRKPLQVITGIGNHSRGHASLPSAVRNFLSENGYRYDEPRPGIITVRPKIR